MADLKINTTKVLSVAGSIRNYNDQMQRDFAIAEGGINRLDLVWDSPAAVSGLRKFWELKDRFCDTRYRVMDNYAKYLTQLVAPGYEEAEEANKSLADAFK